MDIIGDTLSPLFDYLEQEIIADVARRIKKTATYTRTAELHALSLRKLGYSPDRIRSEAMKMLRADAAYRKEVALNTARYKNKVSKLIQEITNKAYKAGKNIIAGAGDMAWYSDLRVWRDAGKDLTTDRAQLEQLVRSMYTQLNGELNNLTRTTGFNTVSGFESVKNLYINELDKATIKLMSGTSSQDQVVRDCILSLAKSGLKCVNYDSGRKDQLDVAVKRALRTGIHQMAGNIQDYNLTEMGENLVYVQEHAGARNKGSGIANHAQWQGKVYYIKPGHEYSEEEARLGYQIRDLWECTGYSVDGAHENNPLGLFGYNCRHLYFPWFEGISEIPEPQPEKNTVMHNGQELDFYAQTQELRKQERNIRSLKREQDALERLGLDHRDTEAKLEEAERKYSAFCRKCKIPETSTNTNYESSTSDITKTKAYKKYLREYKCNGQNSVEKDLSCDIISIKKRLYTRSDPMVEIMGPAVENNIEELQEILTELEKMGVEVEYRENVYAYEVKERGVPGKIIIDPNASLSAWLHEYQHAKDECAVGWNGLRIYKNPNKRYRREQRAYQVEMELAKKMNNDKMIGRLERLLEEERRRIYGQ